MPPVSRGFRGRRAPAAESERLPPGQYLVHDFPVLSAGPTPRTPPDSGASRSARRPGVGTSSGVCRRIPGRLSWHGATVAGVAQQTPRVASLALDVPGWPGHRAGDHVDVRPTAPDGYQAQRS